MAVSLELPSEVFSHVVFVSEKNDARSSKKELQMKAELKTLTKPPKLTLVFRNHLTDYSACSTIANVLSMFFKHILILLGGQQSECSVTLYIKTDITMKD